jgi:hypothetical protein
LRVVSLPATRAGPLGCVPILRRRQRRRAARRRGGACDAGPGSAAGCGPVRTAGRAERAARCGAALRMKGSSAPRWGPHHSSANGLDSSIASPLDLASWATWGARPRTREALDSAPFGQPCRGHFRHPAPPEASPHCSHLALIGGAAPCVVLRGAGQGEHGAGRGEGFREVS